MAQEDKGKEKEKEDEFEGIDLWESLAASQRRRKLDGSGRTRVSQPGLMFSGFLIPPAPGPAGAPRRDLNLAFRLLKGFPTELSTSPSEFCSNLTTLSLRGNEIMHLPKEISVLSALRALDLSKNRVSMLPDALSTLQSLTSLDVSFNQLSALPPW